MFHISSVVAVARAMVVAKTDRLAILRVLTRTYGLSLEDALVLVRGL